MTTWSNTFEQLPISVITTIHDKWTYLGEDSEYSTTRNPSFEGGSVTRTGTRTPNYRELKRSGRLPPQYASRLDTNMKSLKPAQVTFRMRHKSLDITNLCDYTDVVPCGFPTALALPGDEDMFSLVYSEAAANFSADYSTQCAHLASTLAEFDETRQSLANVVRHMSGQYVDRWGKAPRRIQRYRRVTDVMKALADIHLGVVFGINPLLGDAKSIAEALAEIQRRFEPDHYKAYGSATETRTSDTPVSVGGYQGITTALFWQATDGFLQRYKVKLGGRVSIPYANVDPLAIAGITMWDVVPGAWEGVPFSWLIDSFTNIGDVLNATYHPQWYLDKTWMVIVRESTATRVVECVGSNRDNTPDYIVSFAGSPATFVDKQFSWSRSGWVADIRNAGLSWKQPSFRQMTNAASAAVQACATAVTKSVTQKLGPLNRRSYTGPWDLVPRG